MWPKQSECLAFYGDPRMGDHYNPQWARENLVHVNCPWALKMGYKSAPWILIHKKCSASLERVLANVWDKAGRSQATIDKLGYSAYSGSFNYRPMRGKSLLSMHAYGCAIDWNAPQNPHHSRKHLFTDDSLLVQEFKAESWVWGGDWHGNDIDAMHVQAAVV